MEQTLSNIVNSYFSNGEYDKIIELLKDKKDVEAYLVLANVYLLKGDEAKALSILYVNRKELEQEELPLLIDTHVEILKSSNDILGLIKAKDYYSNLPYHSQVVEEKLKEFDNHIAEVEKRIKRLKENNLIDINRIKELLNTESIEKFYNAVSFLDDYSEEKILPIGKDVMINNPNPLIRSLMTIYLGERNCNAALKFKTYDGSIITINPKECLLNHSEDRLNQLAEKVKKYLEKDVTLERNVNSILLLYELSIFPDYTKDDDELFFEAVSIVAKEYCGIEVKTTKEISNLVDDIKKRISI